MGPRIVIASLGLILVLLSIPSLAFDWQLSVLLLFVGIVVIAIPEIQLRRKTRAIALKEKEIAMKASDLRAAESCALCGKPVPKGVAYCKECSEKLT